LFISKQSSAFYAGNRVQDALSEKLILLEVHQFFYR